MHARSIVAGAAAGVLMASAGVTIADRATEEADAQPALTVRGLAAEVDSSNNRSIRGIKQGTKAWNLVAKYLAEPEERIGVQSPRVSQEPGVGGGLPESLLSADVRAKLNAPPGGGPPGPAGASGPAGPDGPVGPTEGSSAVNANQTPDPFPTPDRTLPSPSNPLLVSTSRPGRLHVALTGAIDLPCASGSGLDAWMILDGSPIETSLRTLPGGVEIPITVVGVTDDAIAPGEHELQIGVACFSGDPMLGGSTDNRVQASVIVLG